MEFNNLGWKEKDVSMWSLKGVLAEACSLVIRCLMLKCGDEEFIRSKLQNENKSLIGYKSDSISWLQSVLISFMHAIVYDIFTSSTKLHWCDIGTD